MNFGRGVVHAIIKTWDGGINVQLCIEMKPKIMTLVEHHYHFNTSKAPESIGSNIKLAKTLLKDMNFIYPVGTAPLGPRFEDTDSISPIGSPGWWGTLSSIQKPYHPRGY